MNSEGVADAYCGRGCLEGRDIGWWLIVRHNPDGLRGGVLPSARLEPFEFVQGHRADGTDSCAAASLVLVGHKSTLRYPFGQQPHTAVISSNELNSNNVQ